MDLWEHRRITTMTEVDVIALKQSLDNDKNEYLVRENNELRQLISILLMREENKSVKISDIEMVSVPKNGILECYRDVENNQMTITLINEKDVMKCQK